MQLSGESPPTLPDLHWPCVLVAALAFSRGECVHGKREQGESLLKNNADGRLSFRLLQATDIVFNLFKADGRLQEELRHYY